MSDTSNTSSILNDDTSDVEVIHGTTTVSKVLGVQESTLRKYCALMQKHGYEFHKNSVGHRVFYEKDIETLRKIVELKNSGSLTLNESVKSILDSDIDDVSIVKVTSDISYKKLLEEFSSFKQEQEYFNAELLKQLQSQQDYIKNSIEERDKKLMLALKESQEVRREIASANEKKWWEFWK
jgi:DNA-binding transcriptional MerR regulator